MTENRPDSGKGWTDPDDAPEFTEAMFDAAEFTVGGKIVRKAGSRVAGTVVASSRFVPRVISGGARAVATRKDSKGERELIQPHEKRYQRRNDDGTFGQSDDQSKSLSQDVRQSAKAKKPRGQGDKGD